MKSAKTASTVKSSSLAFPFPLLLAVVLLVLFCKSFLPDYVHFSNDGPLGAINSRDGRIPAGFLGTWIDLNDIGTSGGTATPEVSTFTSWILGPVGYSKFYPVIALFILGLGAWTFFRQLKLSPLAATLGALAATLNSSYFGDACWGTASHQIALGAVFFAMALVMANSDDPRSLVRWARLALAGMAVGYSVMEGADCGAIFSMFVAAYVFFESVIEENVPALKRIARGIGSVAIIAIFAAFIAWQTVNALIGTYIVGVEGMGQDKNVETSQQHWDWATQWSLPKKETLGVIVPGLFGYKLNTPAYMMDFLHDDYIGGEYWGGMGRSPEIDRFFDSGAQGSHPPGLMRFGYAGYYCGILVALVTLFTIAQSLRKQSIMFSLFQRHMIWFWTATMIIALLLAWGRFAPFYHFIYILPYFSTIRNPAKFLAIFYLGMIIIFAYGIDGLYRRYMQAEGSANKTNSWLVQFKNWRANVRGFDRNWSLFCLLAFVGSILAWLVYASAKTSLISYLQKVDFDEDTAKQIASFSIGQVEWFLAFFAVAIVLFILVLAGVFSGKRAKVGGFLLIAFLVADLGRANLPWIIHWNYKQKYASNPIIDILRDKPYEHRVADLPPSNSLFEQLYRIEWMQHHFLYYNIQCLDVIQSPRVSSDMMNYEMALGISPEMAFTRKWQLSNTRYLLGPTGYIDSINDQLDPTQRRFRVLQRFNIVPKPGIEQPTELEQLTAVPDDNGEYALFEFTGALPRVKLYSNWEVNTNDPATLKTLTSANFDPQKTVLVSNPLPAGAPMTNTVGDNAGTVQFTSYAPKDIIFDAQALAPSVLLLNDRFDPNWRVSVDGKPAELLRCNFIMRGVYLTPGSHTVEFSFSLPHGPLYVTLAAMGVGILLCVFLYVSTHTRSVVVKKQSKHLASI
jgi:hypothetical protein